MIKKTLTSFYTSTTITSTSTSTSATKKRKSFQEVTSEEISSTEDKGIKNVKLDPEMAPTASTSSSVKKPEDGEKSTKITINIPRKICERWFTDFPWLSKLSNEGLSCKWCRRAGSNLDSPFGDSTGCFTYKKDALMDHNLSKSHKATVEAIIQEKNNRKGENSLDNYFNNRLKVSSTCIGLLLCNAYFCSWNTVSIKFSESLNSHMKALGLNVGSHYLDHNAIRGMVLSLGYTIQKNISDKAKDSNSFLSILIDESTDYSNESKLLIMLRYCIDFNPTEKYLAICKLPNATAETIYNQVSEVLKQEEYISPNLVCILGDNAPTIQGEIQGVISRFKKDLPYLKEGRCLSHLNNLVIKSLISKFPKINNIKNLVYKLVDFFKKSPKKTQLFQGIMEENEEEVKSLICPFDIRWASLYNSLSRLLEVYPSLIEAFEEISDEDDDATALGFFNKLRDLETLSIILILNDLLAPFFKIDQALQKSGCTIAIAKEKVKTLQTSLNVLYNGDEDFGWWFASFKEEFETTGKFKGIEITNKSKKSLINLRKSAVQYRDFLLEAIETRFSSLESFDVFDIFDFATLVQDQEKWKNKRYSFKKEEIKNLVKFYNTHVDKKHIITEKTISDEWNFITSSLLTVSLDKKNEDIYRMIDALQIAPNFIKIINLYLTYPVSNAPVERGFSLMNLIKSEIRNSIKDDLLDSALSIKYNGPNPDTISSDSQFFIDAEEHWKTQKKRYYC